LPKVSFHSEVPSFKLKEKTKLKAWLETVVTHHSGKIGFLNYIFCDDAYLLNINQEYLQHDTLTDIITFRYQEQPNPLESDIYISVERVRENATAFGVTFEQELRRVMVHGVLHLLGFKDKTTQQEKAMREAENTCLTLYI